MSFVVAEPRAVLGAILERARALGPKGVLAFDLDSTLFDNRPRQVVILREFGRHKALKVLEDHGLEHWTSGWDLRGAMVNAGLAEPHVEGLFPEAKDFWRDRFFSSAYCEHDVAIPGAPEFLAEAHASGAQLVYLTGRHEEMRAGTVRALEKCGMPAPPQERVRLVMKPTLGENDDAFKERAHAEVRGLGTVLAAFDNEPTHANGYRKSFPEATVVHLATDHSGRPVALLEGIVSIADFRR